LAELSLLSRLFSKKWFDCSLNIIDTTGLEYIKYCGVWGKTLMAEKLTILLAQLNFHVGNISGNLKKIEHSIHSAVNQFQADMIVFPELAITGYPPKDLLFHPSLATQVQEALHVITNLSQNIAIIIGFPDYTDQHIYNAAGFFYQGQCLSIHHKQFLPNRGVFDEKRYFSSGKTANVIPFKGHQIGILICEDIWQQEPIQQLKKQFADIVISINASPFDYQKLAQRQALLTDHASKHQVNIMYVQTVGGQDDLIFDGGSMAITPQGKISHQAILFEEALLPIQCDSGKQIMTPANHYPQPMPLEGQMLAALTLGIKDYVSKNGFKEVVLGLSGGIDSALTLYLAVTALGAAKVHAVMMPSAFTSSMSLEDAKKLAGNLNIDYQILPITDIYEQFDHTLSAAFSGQTPDTTEENLQARIRGMLLMALSNKFGWLVLTTGNKSEMAVGYATLYGDMAGGFAVLKDVSKQMVYRLSNYCNRLQTIIPPRIITRPPSAELAHNQQDSDNLPSYDILDNILEAYIEHDRSRQQIIEQGFDAQLVDQVLSLVDRNEYKRRQAPPGPRVTPRALSDDRRYPITLGFKHQSMA